MKRSFTFERCIDYGDDHAGDIRDAGLTVGWEDPLEKVMATHSSILTWRIPRTEEPGRLQSVGSQSLLLLLLGMWPRT